MHDKFFWIEEIKRILEEKRSEWQKLEFKSGSELLSGRPDGANGTISPNEVKFDIAKDVSSMANASGGTIIYGIDEDDSKADSISSVTQECIQAVAIEQILNSNIYPPILDIDIIEIALKEYSPLEFPVNDGKLIVIDIPRSTTAHMVERTFGKAEQRSGSRIAFCYYHRLATENRPMSGSMVEDVMGRSTKPNLVCKPFWNAHRDNREYSIGILLENCSNVVSVNWKCVCKISGFKGVSGLTNNLSVLGAEKYGIGLYSPNDEYSFNGPMENVTIKWTYYSERVLHPTDKITLPTNIDKNSCFIYREALEKNKDAELEIIVYADAMVPKPLSIRLGDIRENLTPNI
jgi:hypothetical protein